ncbi:hypothetical protein QBC39DRAFT_396300 [Podospora conica]|nr:hypothetical protein QBC39DRAFT_396300 [Schizothecium conicum]
MPNRQWFCWNLCLKYSCGCSSTSSEHVCNEDRGVKCHSWTAVRVTDRTCDKHRELDGCFLAEGEEEEGRWVDEELGRAAEAVVSEGGGAGLERGRRRVGGGGGEEMGGRRAGGW